MFLPNRTYVSFALDKAIEKGHGIVPHKATRDGVVSATLLDHTVLRLIPPKPNC